MAKLTALVINWNGLGFLKTLMPTLKKQTYRDFDILVVDQGSTDGSEKWLKKNKIKFVQNGKNLGFSGGVNSGLKKVRSKYVAILNNDMKLEPNCFSLLMETIEKDPKIGAVQTLIANWDGSEVESTGLIVTHSSFIATRDKHKPYVKKIESPKEVHMANGSGTIFRMEAIKKVGFFDEDFNPIYNEDADLSLSMKKAGYRLMIQPSAVIYHYSGHTKKALGYAGRLGFHRNRYRLMRKHWTKAQWAKAGLWFPLVAGFYLLRRRDPAPFHATFDFLTRQLDKKKWK